MNSRDRRSELDAFKELNLSVVASSFGYKMVKAKSTRHSVLMESSNDKIIVSKNGKHYVYCSVFNDNSNGTIIDFAQRAIEPGASLGRVRQLLRPFLDSSHYASIQKKHEGDFAKTIRQSSTDFLAVAARYSQFEPIVEHHEYLCGKRGIPLEMLLSGRLKGRVLGCSRTAAAIFPHWGPADLGEREDRIMTGYEIKGPGRNMFSKGGRKGLWASHAFETDNKLVIAESALDAVSYVVVNGALNARLISVAGRATQLQLELIQAAIEKMPSAAKIISAFDNDQAGDLFSSRVSKILIQYSKNKYEFVDSRPPFRGQDWNDMLIQ